MKTIKNELPESVRTFLEVEAKKHREALDRAGTEARNCGIVQEAKFLDYDDESEFDDYDYTRTLSICVENGESLQATQVG